MKTISFVCTDEQEEALAKLPRSSFFNLSEKLRRKLDEIIKEEKIT